MASTSPKKGIARRSANRRGATSAAKVDAGYRDLFNDIPIGLYRTMANGRIVEANPALATIFRCANPSELVGQIEDGGAGFAPARAIAEERTAGLAGMQERAAALGGTLPIDSIPGTGTRILAQLPLPLER
jgi:glucose-6-phosphate-specific signal transduction histidine kinase